MPKEDPVEKLSKMIEDRINAAFADRDRKSTEEKDPWAKLEGMVDRAVGRHFEAFAKGIEDAGAGGDGKGRGDRTDDEDRPKLGILGL